MFYCTRLRRFQEQIQQKQKDLWNSGDEYSVGGKSNASSQSELSVKRTCTSPSKNIKGKEDEQSQTKLSLNKKNETKRDLFQYNKSIVLLCHEFSL